GAEVYLVVNPAHGIHGAGDLQATARKRPGGLNCGGATGQLTFSCERLRELLGEEAVTTIPYPGAAQAMNALVAGQVDLVFAPRGVMAALAEAGRVRPLALASDSKATPPFDRLPQLKATWADWATPNHTGLLVAGETPRPVIERLNGVFNSVLLKPGSLTTDEFAVMRTHVALGVEIIEGSEWLREAREVVECHHEKYDGSGYPRGLAGEEIPLVARIFAIVDVFDALTSHRAYKTEVPLEMALSNIRQGAGSHFDPRLVAVFEGIASRIHAAIGPLEGPVLVQRLREKAIEYFIADSLGSRTA
ncbi:MAG TPA: tripartite tricarboxylate transporter substrate-binding protein, partial [Accumulibacter sp.]|nr:tripartite tricarboxylate transporter substrate-binding protein [Accumulibacter sp.]